MKRSDLAHILRAASAITGDPDIVVIGSQSILGKYSHIALPEDATRSIEADIMFVNDPDGHKGDLVDGSIGELSHFQEAFGVYGQGVSLETATLPGGWGDRLIAFTFGDVGSSRAMCLDPHDLVVSKMVAGREKDHEFSRAVIAAHLVDVERLLELTGYLPLPEGVRRRVRHAIVGVAQRAGQAPPRPPQSPPADQSTLDVDRVPKGTPGAGQFRRRSAPGDANLSSE